MMKYIDAHCHLSDRRLPPECEVTNWICNATTETGWDAVLSRAAQDSRAAACIGVHPWYVSGAQDGWDARMRDALLANPRAMIGECGLDKLRPDFAAQVKVCRRQLSLANELGRTAHVHCVRAWDDMLASLHVTHPPRVVAHGFYAHPQVIRAAGVHTDMYFSYSDVIVRHPSDRLNASIAATPLDKILVETDSMPGKSAEILPTIISAIADIKSIDVDELTEIIYNNAKRIIDNG